jgi:hypothetical protein
VFNSHWAVVDVFKTLLKKLQETSRHFKKLQSKHQIPFPALQRFVWHSSYFK